MALTAILAFSSCQKRNVGGETPIVPGESQTYTTDLCLTVPVSATKVGSMRAATEFGTDHGTAQEYAVEFSKTWFVFFDEAGRNLGAVQTQEPTWIMTPNTDNKDHITAQAKVTIDAAMEPKSMIVVVNATDKVRNILTRMSLSELKSNWNVVLAANETINGYVKENVAALLGTNEAPKGGFLMTNAAMLDSNSSVIREVSTDGFVYTENNRPENYKPVEIFLERVAGKATVNVKEDAENLLDKAQKIFTIKQKDAATTNPRFKGLVSTTFAVKLNGWALNGLNKSTFPVKNVKGTYPALDGTSIWKGEIARQGKTTYYRTYWAEDGNYTTNDNFFSNANYFDAGNKAKANLHFIKLDEASHKMDGKDADYALENTGEETQYADSKTAAQTVTHYLIKGSFMTYDADKKTAAPYKGNVYRYSGVYFTEDEMKALLVKDIATRGYQTADGKAVTADMLTIEPASKDPKNMSDVKGITVKSSVDINNGREASDVNFDEAKKGTDIKGKFLGTNDVVVYHEGRCYYAIPIKHFTESKTSEGVAKLGYYGFVRNHWYTLDIKGLKGFGHPGGGTDVPPGDNTPGKPIIPEVIEDNTKLIDVELYMLSWAKPLQQSVTLGETNNWSVQ